jgi:hypothetical protein
MTMEAIERHIRLGIDRGFLGLPFAGKLKTEAAEKGLVIEVEPTPSNWSDAYKNFNAPHRHTGLFTIELIPAFFSDPIIEKKLSVKTSVFFEIKSYKGAPTNEL